MVKPGGQTHPHRWSICPVSRFHETLSRPNALPVIVQCDWLMLVSGLLHAKRALSHNEKGLLAILFQQIRSKTDKKSGICAETTLLSHLPSICSG